MAITSMNRLIITATLGLAIVSPAPLRAQGVPMSPDFLPLEVGNLWRFEVRDAAGRLTGRFEIEILEHQIVGGFSLYVFSRFPLRADGDPDAPVAVRFDPGTRQYVYTDGQREGYLFPSEGVQGEVLGTTDSGLPLRVRLSYPDRTLEIERGRGLTGGTILASNGEVGVLTLLGSRVGNETVGSVEALPTEPVFRIEPPSESVVLAVDADPLLEVSAAPGPEGHRLVLRAVNDGDRIMAFEFGSSQDFDFVVTDPDTGREVWRWARRRFFSQVVRSEALRAGETWEFGAVWDHRDDDREAAPPGTYLLKGVIATTPPIESASIPITVE